MAYNRLEQIKSVWNEKGNVERIDQLIGGDGAMLNDGLILIST